MSGKFQVTRWTPEALQAFLDRVLTPGTTSQQIATEFGVSQSRVNQMVARAGLSARVNAMRKQWMLEQTLQRRREQYGAAFREHVTYAKAARACHVSRYHFDNIFSQIFTPEEILEMMPKRACIVCGKNFVHRQPNAKACSPQCIRKRRRYTVRLRNQKRGRTHMLMRDRDYEMLKTMLVLHEGNCKVIGDVLGFTRYAVSNAVSRWGLADFIADVRAQREERRCAEAVALLESGLNITKVCNALGYKPERLSLKLRARGYEHLIPIRTCIGCGKIFTRAHPQQYTCSPECHRQHVRNRERRKRERYRAARMANAARTIIPAGAFDRVIERAKHL